VELIKALSEQYPSITPQRIAGHSDIAPGRKTDPGSGFDWQKLSSLLA
jgi:AmpD protein